MITFTILLKCIMKKQKFNTLLIFQVILKQSPEYFRNSRFVSSYRDQSRKLFFLVIFSWILILAVFTYIFSCSMVLSHFKFKSVKIVENLDDVLRDANLNVAGRFSIYSLFGNNYLGLRKRAENMNWI